MMPDVATAIERGKREITEDVASGRVPTDVPSFAALHDYVDANEYGGLCDEGSDWSSDTDAANAVQDGLDRWIREGRDAPDPA